ncbi:MAG: FtsX-like permease family protein [Bacteroidetes bacterium]|jgi:putative ABC transport system permease protein|nr:FtsX-like permease family protein [Bacteroidota bacterium]
MYKNYFKTALRNLLKNKAYSAINILGLSVGVACCMLIFLYGKDEITYDQFFKNKENIYRIATDMTAPSGEITKFGSTGMMQGPAFKKDIPEIEEFMRLQSTSFNVRSKGEVFEQQAIYVDENFFSVFSFQLLYGNPKTALKELRSLVISETVAEKYFGRTDVLGQHLELGVGKNVESFEITGVARDAPLNSSVQLQMLAPMKYNQLKNDDQHWMNFFLNTFLVLKPGSDIKAVEAKIERVFATEAAADLKEMAEKYNNEEKYVFHLQALPDMHLSADYPADNGLTGASNSVYSYILTGIAGLILLIACINFVNLTIARSLKRAKEIGVRKVIGSSRKQLIYQFLGESFLLSFLAFLAACMLTYLVLPFFNEVSGKQLSFSYLLDAKLVIGYFTLFCLTGLLAGFYPALILSRFKPVETLYGKLRLSGKDRLSKSMVVFQFALSTFLIIATITVYSQFVYLTDYDLGLNTKNVVSVNTPVLNDAKLDIVKQELMKSPGFTMISADQGGTWNTVANVNNGKEISFNYKHIDANYLPLFQIPLVQGRNFSKTISSDTVESVMVNEAFVREAGWKKPLEEMVDFFYRNKKYHVIGVVKDYHFEALTEKIRPQLLGFRPEDRYSKVYIKIADGSRAQALAHMEKTFKKLHPGYPYQYKFVEDANREKYEKESKWKQIISFSAILTVLISCMGLFGLAALSAEKRAKEIGIRKVFGASVAIIAGKLSGDFIKLVGIAACIALPLAWWVMNKWLQNYPYRIELKVSMLVVSIAAVLVVALLTISYQSIKAALSNPVKNLRTE